MSFKYGPKAWEYKSGGTLCGDAGLLRIGVLYPNEPMAATRGY